MEEADQRLELALVSEQLQRIQKILRELVTFSRPASTETSWVTTSEIVEEALNIAKYYKGTKRRSITVERAPDLPLIHGVRDQLVQIFLNLILNAVDATRKDGHIGIVARACSGFIEVAVRDDGSGISAENLPRLFQPYFTTKQHGTGLGLFVSRKLAFAHGGSIEVESHANGSVFRVRLPVESPAMEAAVNDRIEACLSAVARQ